MNVRRTILLAAAAALASAARAEGNSAADSQPPSDQSGSQSWYQRNAEKARELGDRGTGAVKRGASATGKKVNEGGQAATAKVVGTKTVAGELADVAADQVTVKQPDGTPLSLRITESTKVTVGGKQGSVGSLQQGDEVRASYAQSGGSATAMKIEVRRSASSPSSAGRRGSGAASGSGKPSGAR
jgi:hypothetical protein